MLFDYQTFDPHSLQLKTPVQRQMGQTTCYFIPIRHKKRQIFLKTPKIVVPFGLDQYENQKSYVISLDDCDISPVLARFVVFLHQVEQYCMTTVECQPSHWEWLSHNQRMVFKSFLKDHRFRLKISPRTELYDEEGQLRRAEEGYALLTPQCQVVSLLELGGIWVREILDSQFEYGITWKVVQMRIYPPFRPLEGVSMLDDAPPPPPMPPPPPLPAIQSGRPIPMWNCFAMITSGQFDLKKVPQEPSGSNKSQNHTQPCVSLAEILKIRQGLRGITQHHRCKTSNDVVIDGLTNIVTSPDISASPNVSTLPHAEHLEVGKEDLS